MDELRTAEFDSLILATDAESALTILGKEATWMERHVLGGVKYLHDLTVTHMDTEYMRKVIPFPSLFTRLDIFRHDFRHAALRDRVQTRAHRLKRNFRRAAAGRDRLPPALLHLPVPVRAQEAGDVLRPYVLPASAFRVCWAVSHLPNDLSRQRRVRRALDKGRNKAGFHHRREVVEAAEPPMATLCACRSLDVDDQWHAWHMVRPLPQFYVSLSISRYRSYAGAWTGVYLPTFKVTW